ncbi:hypothetical protein B0H14DRAFT_2960554 [Mycena olivaceomarginata]|nr:hypothetical protein B0H14DRAFT_2960554 [Mycena olivaceomarginata]
MHGLVSPGSYWWQHPARTAFPRPAPRSCPARRLVCRRTHSAISFGLQHMCVCVCVSAALLPLAVHVAAPAPYAHSVSTCRIPARLQARRSARPVSAIQYPPCISTPSMLCVLAFGAQQGCHATHFCFRSRSLHGWGTPTQHTGPPHDTLCLRRRAAGTFPHIRAHATRRPSRLLRCSSGIFR